MIVLLIVVDGITLFHRCVGANTAFLELSVLCAIYCVGCGCFHLVKLLASLILGALGQSVQCLKALVSSSLKMRPIKGSRQIANTRRLVPMPHSFLVNAN